jgi:hypothetical protein
MPVAVVQEWSEGGTDTRGYDAVHERLMAADAPPEGFLVHTAGATPDGGFRIVEVWESRDHFERFAREILVPLVQELGDDRPAPATTIYDLHGFAVVDRALAERF